MRFSSPTVTFSTRTGKCSLRLVAGESALEKVELNPADGAPYPCEAGQTVIRETLQQLKAYFAGELFVFDLPLAMHGTEFQQRVWRALTGIPYGETRSYGDLARSIGQPTAVRALGAANGQNPLAIIVPCHRVIGATGKLVGYGGGLPMKKMLLDLEAENYVRSRHARAISRTGQPSRGLDS